LTQTSLTPGRTIPITRADDLLSRLADGDWQRRSCGEGSKGQRFYDWALVRFGSNLHVSDETPADGFAHTLLIRRSITDPGDVTYFLAHARHRSPAATRIRVAGTRWKIEENNEQGKDLIGIDQHQVRTWTAWHHTITRACSPTRSSPSNAPTYTTAPPPAQTRPTPRPVTSTPAWEKHTGNPAGKP
jgi:hypothetical protein